MHGRGENGNYAAVNYLIDNLPWCATAEFIEMVPFRIFGMHLEPFRKIISKLPKILALLVLSNCAGTLIERSNRTDIAVVTADYSQQITWPWTLRLEIGQRLRPVRADGQDRWCTTTPSLIPQGWVIDGPKHACLLDRNGRGRFDEVFGLGNPFPRTGYPVNIPYMLEAMQ